VTDQTILVDFRFRGAGWADIEFRIHDQQFLIGGISYTTDAVGDLLRAALMIATGAWSASVSFDGEPHESRLVLGGVWDRDRWRKGFFVRVIEFADIYKKEPDERGIVSFDAECTEREFALAVLEAGRRILADGVENYAWADMPFPTRALRALETALAMEEPPPKTDKIEGETFVQIFGTEPEG
jgi:hypothetical protein